MRNITGLLSRLAYQATLSDVHSMDKPRGHDTEYQGPSATTRARHLADNAVSALTTH